jgi:hypothetical protein
VGVFPLSPQIKFIVSSIKPSSEAAGLSHDYQNKRIASTGKAGLNQFGHKRTITCQAMP